MHCGECGAMITAEEKVKYQQNGNVHRYVFYHCTKRKDPNCSQRSIEEKELEKQIASELATIEIPADFKDWAMARLRTLNEKEVDDRDKIYGTQRREYEASVRRIDNLIDMRANTEITEEEFKNRKEHLLKEKERFQLLLQDTDKRVENWLEVAERGFVFAEKARTTFAEGGSEERKEIFAALGSDLVLKDRKLTIDWGNLLFPIQTMAKEVRAIQGRLEPLKIGQNKGKMGEIYAQSPKLLRD